MKMRLVATLCAATACSGVSPPPPDPTDPQAAEPATPAAPAAAVVPVAAGPSDASAGEAVYAQYCVACHQADGSGLNGMLAANFRDDRERLANEDAQLLLSIRDGKTGKVGTMPPWGTTLSEQEMRDALAYIRKSFGG